MNYDLPTEVRAGGKTYHITKKCEYRMVLDVIEALNDTELTDQEKVICSLLLFYEELTRESIRNCPDLDELTGEMLKIINGGEIDNTPDNKPRLMDWEHDFRQIAPPVSRVLGYDVRTPGKYLHWWSFLGAYMEIGGDCTFATVVSIRNKRAKGQKLEKWELDFLREHREMVDLPQKLTSEEKAILASEW